MSVISGMDEVIAYIKSQDEKIKALETNEKVREEFIVDMKAEIVELKKGISKEGVEEAAKVIYNLLNESKKLQEENEKLKADARTNLDYSVKYEKDLVKKDEEIAQLKEQNEGLEMYWSCFIDYADPKGHLECPNKEFIDGWTDDEEVRQSLYEDFNIEEEEEEEIEEQFAKTTFK